MWCDSGSGWPAAFLLLLAFQLQFLPYHGTPITYVHRATILPAIGSRPCRAWMAPKLASREKPIIRAIVQEMRQASSARGKRRVPGTWDQTAGLAAQQRDLKATGVDKVFSEQASSVAQRTKLTEFHSYLRPGDVLTVTKPDRLARSTAELLSIEADLSKRGSAWWSCPWAASG